MKQQLKAMRPLNGAIAALGVFVGLSVAQKTIAFPPELFIGMLSAFLITSGGNIINDYFDFEIDKKLGKNTIEKQDRKTLLLSLGLFTVGIIIASTINNHTLLIASGVSILMIVYSGLMRKMKFVGNWVVAIGTSATILFGAAIVQNYSAILLLALSAMFANVAREIIKDCQDIKGDVGEKKTLPMLVKKETVNKTVLLMYICAIAFGAGVWILGMLTSPYYIILLFGATVLFYRSWKLLGEQKFKASQEYSKYGMLLALAAFLGGVL